MSPPSPKHNVFRMSSTTRRADDKNCFLVLQIITPFVASIRDLGQLDTAISSAGIRESWLLGGMKNLLFVEPLRLASFLQVLWFTKRNAGIDSKIHFQTGFEEVRREMRDLAIYCNQLQCLAFSLSDINDLDLGVLGENGCKLLVKVKLYCCPRVTDVGIGHLVKACRTTLQFFSTTVHLTDKTLGHLATCNALRVVEFVTNGRSAEEGDLSEHVVLNFAKGCPDLQAFRSYNWNITNLGVKALTDNCPGLRSICLKHAPFINSGSLGSHCGSLLQLHLWHSPITDEGVRDIVARCSNLRFVQLVRCNHITNVSLELLQSLHLEYLNIRLCDNIPLSVLHPCYDEDPDRIEQYIPVIPEFRGFPYFVTV